MDGTVSDAAERAAGAALDWLVTRDAAESCIAAHEAGVAESREPARRWVRWILDRERGGAWDGDVLATAHALLTLRELREAASLVELDPAIGRGLDWIRGHQGAPGSWTDGCDPERHRRGFCHHLAGGFYSAAPPDQPLNDVALPSGARPAGEEEARFCVSTEALRCTLLWRGAGTDARLHLEALRRVVAGWTDGPLRGLTTTALLAAIHALLASEAEADRAAASDGLDRVAGMQRGDGSWVDADPFHALEVFLAAEGVGVGGERVEDALGYGARLLSAAQRSDGSWGPDHGPRRALIGWRTVRRSGPPRPAE